MSIHCIFDLDGTLFDSEWQIYNAVNSTRKIHGFTDLSIDSARALIGLPAAHLFRDVDVDEETIGFMVEQFRENLRNEILINNPLFAGVEYFIDTLRKKSIRLSIATTKPTNLAQFTVFHSVLRNKFDHIQGTDGFRPKPDPTVIQKCMELDQSNFLFMFGDRTEDMEAAKSAGITGIGISQTIHNEEQLRVAGAQHVFKNFQDFDNIINVFLSKIKEVP